MKASAYYLKNWMPSLSKTQNFLGSPKERVRNTRQVLRFKLHYIFGSQEGKNLPQKKSRVELHSWTQNLVKSYNTTSFHSSGRIQSIIIDVDSPS